MKTLPDVILASNSPRQKKVLGEAGGYSVEDLPKDYIDKIEGEVSTILGLPLHIVNRHLEFLKVRR